MADTANLKDALGEKKPPLWLVPCSANIYESKVFALGAKKYGPYNWREKKVKATVYLSAALRHIASTLDGEDVDPESGQPHVAHARACMSIYLDALATGNLVDDRPTPGVASKLITQLTETEPAKVDVGAGFQPMHYRAYDAAMDWVESRLRVRQIVAEYPKFNPFRCI